MSEEWGGKSSVFPAVSLVKFGGNVDDCSVRPGCVKQTVGEALGYKVRWKHPDGAGCEGEGDSSVRCVQLGV